MKCLLNPGTCMKIAIMDPTAALADDNVHCSACYPNYKLIPAEEGNTKVATKQEC